MKLKYFLSISFFCLYTIPGQSQTTFGAPNCGTVSADSTCFTKATPSTCTASSQPANQRTSCPAGYVGQFNQTGTRNMCTGVVTWNTGGDTSSCTNCGAALTTAETDAVVSAIVAQSESINLAFMDYVFPGFNYKDGANVTNPLTGTVIGRAFRDHVWVSPDAYSSGQLPTTNRMNYLSQQGMVQANFPPSSNLPKDSKGNPITNVAMLYLQSLTSVQASGVTSCTGDGMDGCHVSCTQPGSGWQQQFCHTKTVQFYSCSDSYAVSTGVGTWQPTKSVTVPYTSTSPQNYAQKEWDWGSAFQWNGLDANGGNVFMCNETINGCVGWKSTSSEYKCRTPVTYACSYYDSAAGKTVNTTCSSCDPAQGAFWDYLLTQSNDCPLVPGLSTRASEGETRTVWQSDMGFCPINGGGASGGGVTSCPSNQVLLGTGSCGCPAGSTWDGSMCQTASCPAGSSVTSACPSGQTGSIVTTTTYAGASCASTTTVQNNCQTLAGSCLNGATDYPTCTPPVTPPPPIIDGFWCSDGSDPISNGGNGSCTCQEAFGGGNHACNKAVCPADSSVTSACPSGQTGSVTTTTSYTIDRDTFTNGWSCIASQSVQNNCTTGASCPASNSTTSACPAGQTGSITTTTSYSGPTCAANTTIQNNCQLLAGTCNNGATNYPDCTTSCANGSLLQNCAVSYVCMVRPGNNGFYNTSSTIYVDSEEAGYYNTAYADLYKFKDSELINGNYYNGGAQKYLSNKGSGIGPGWSYELVYVNGGDRQEDRWICVRHGN